MKERIAPLIFSNHIRKTVRLYLLTLLWSTILVGCSALNDGVYALKNFVRASFVEITSEQSFGFLFVFDPLRGSQDW